MTERKTEHRTNLINSINHSATLGDAIDTIHTHLTTNDDFHVFTKKERAIAHFVHTREGLPIITNKDRPQPIDETLSLNEWLFCQYNEFGIAQDGSVIVFDN